MARAADHLIAQLKQEIANGDLRPGDQLEETALAERFGVSRTPIREAVRSMVDCGLLELRSRKGAVVRIYSAKELLDLFEVAAELEGMASRLAAERLSQNAAEDIKNGLALCRTAAANEDATAYAAANIAFHGAIHRASGNMRLQDQLDQLQIHINPYRSMPYKMRGRLQTSVEEHQAIMQTIFEGDGGKADTLMRDHMMLQGQRLPMVLQALDAQQ